MSKKKPKYLWLSRLISRLFDPFFEIPVALLLAVYIAVKEGLRWRFLGILLFVDILVPLIFFLTMLYHKQITTWDVRERKQRIPLYIFTMICHLGGVWLAHELGKVELAHTLGIFWLTGMGFALITAFWKISLHTGVNAFLASLIVATYGINYFWIYLVVIIVSWARIYDKHHTWQQLLAGAMLGALGGWLGIMS